MSTISTPRKDTGFRLHSNPVLTRMEKITERAQVSDVATYSGIFTKTAYFLLVTIASVLAYALLTGTLFANGSIRIPVEMGSDTARSVSYITFSTLEAVLTGVSALLTFIMPFVCAFSVGATPLCGTLYCVGEGYLLAVLVYKGLPLMNLPTSIGMLALFLTIMVVGFLAFLYTKRIVSVNRKFYAFLFAVAGAVILSGVLTFILYLIPFTRPLVSGLLQNPMMAVLADGISVVLASLFILSDFAVIENCVEEQYPVRYEWMAAFGLAFSVIWLYLKILEILIRIFANSKNNNK